MKKVLLGVVLFSFLLISNHAQATNTPDTTPRIMYWWGKVNQHVDGYGAWQSDSDGTSGANLDKLSYCKKWYPNTISVIPYQSETIDTWRRAGGYEQSGYTNTVVSDKCVQSENQIQSFKIISPNGGEVYNAGDRMIVSWTSSGYSSSSLISIDLYTKGVNGEITNTYLTGAGGPSSSGNSSADIPIPLNTPSGSNYIIYGTIYDPVTSLSKSDQSDNTFTINKVVSNLDVTPRIAMWYGKVNQHVDSQGNWITDPDGVSGAGSYSQWGSEGYGDRKLLYCQKFYPKTTSVEEYKNETINSWREKYNTGGPHTLAVMTTKCVQGFIDTNIPSVTVILPNGGESYTSGQQVTIRWKTNNIKQNPDTLVAVMDDRIPDWQTLSLFGSSPALNYAKLISSNGIENIYEYSFTAPKTFNDSLPKQYQNIYGGNHYKILVNVLIGGQAGTPTQQVIEDLSDNVFSINFDNYNQRKDKIFLMGGSNSRSELNDVWSSTDMSNWTNIVPNGSTSNMWSSRNLMRTLFFNGKIYSIGGNKGQDIEPEGPVSYQFWSSLDGIKWQQLKNLPWNSDPYEHTLSKSYVVYNDKIWAIGGLNHDPNYCHPFCYLNTIWSYNGNNWKKETNAPWSGREMAGTVVYNGKIWMIGGYNAPSNTISEVWSFDGINWKQEASSPYGLAFESGHQPIGQFQNKIWILGDMQHSGNNVLSFDGSAWQQQSNAPWSNRANHLNLIANGLIYIFSGVHSENNIPPTYPQDAWSFDGVLWTKLSTPPWVGRGYFDGVVTPVGFGQIAYGITTSNDQNKYQIPVTSSVNKDKGSQSLSGRILKIGSKGDDVKALQKKLGIKADGVYGKGTASKLKTWQKLKGITADGVFNTMSQAKMNSVD